MHSCCFACQRNQWWTLLRCPTCTRSWRKIQEPVSCCRIPATENCWSSSRATHQSSARTLITTLLLHCCTQCHKVRCWFWNNDLVYYNVTDATEHLCLTGNCKIPGWWPRSLFCWALIFLKWKRSPLLLLLHPNPKRPSRLPPTRKTFQKTSGW